MTIETLLALAVPFTVILGPLFAALFTITARLAKIEQRLDGDSKHNTDVLQRHDKAIHDIRNSLQAIALQLARYEHDEKK